MKNDDLCQIIDGELVCQTSKTERMIQAIKSEAPSIVCATLGIAHPLVGTSCVIAYHGIKMASDALKGVWALRESKTRQKSDKRRVKTSSIRYSL